MKKLGGNHSYARVPPARGRCHAKHLGGVCGVRTAAVINEGQASITTAFQRRQVKGDGKPKGALGGCMHCIAWCSHMVLLLPRMLLCSRMVRKKTLGTQVNPRRIAAPRVVAAPYTSNAPEVTTLDEAIHRRASHHCGSATHPLSRVSCNKLLPYRPTHRIRQAPSVLFGCRGRVTPCRRHRKLRGWLTALLGLGVRAWA